jgi:hypothetical protein
MSRLYIAPIGSDGDRVDRFEEAVVTPVKIPEDSPDLLEDVDSTRLWGTTMGEQKTVLRIDGSWRSNLILR